MAKLKNRLTMDRMDILCFVLQNVTIDRDTLDTLVTEGAKKFAELSTEPVDPTTIYNDVVTVLMLGAGIRSEIRQNVVIDALIGNRPGNPAQNPDRETK